MKFFENLKLKKLENKKIQLKNFSKNQRDDEKIVDKAIDVWGISEMGYASERIRSEAKNILQYAGKYPEVVYFMPENIRQNYWVTRDGKILTNKPIVEDPNEVSFVSNSVELFGLRLIDENPNCIQCFTNDLALETARYLFGDEKHPTVLYGKKFENDPNDYSMDIKKQLVRYTSQKLQLIMSGLILPLEMVADIKFCQNIDYVLKAMDKYGVEQFTYLDDDHKTDPEFLTKIYSKHIDAAKYFEGIFVSNPKEYGGQPHSCDALVIDFVTSFAPEIFKYLPERTASWLYYMYCIGEPFIDDIYDKQHNTLGQTKSLCMFPDKETLGQIKNILIERGITTPTENNPDENDDENAEE